MQFILTSQELAKLEQTDLELRERHKDMVQDLCKRVACSEKVKYKYGDQVREHVWGCILVANSCPVYKVSDSMDGIGGRPDYCDHCPVQKQCPHPHKEYGE